MKINKPSLKTATGLATVAMFASGCTSMNDFVASNGLDPTSGNPKSFYENAGNHHQQSGTNDFTQEILSDTDKMYAIAKKGTRDVEVAFTALKSNYYSDASLSTNVVTVGDTIEVHFSYESPKGYFPLGQYDIRNTVSHDNMQNAAFLNLITKGVLRMKSDLDRLGASSHEIHAEFFGQADGTPVSGSGVLYAGEYGNILLGRTVTTLNGNPHQFRINKYQKMGNPELAAVRAYSLAEFVRGIAGGVQIQSKYTVSVSDIVGKKQRHAHVVMKLKMK